MYNKIILIGRLVRDIDLRYTTSGNAVSKFTLAVDRDFKNKQGEKETDFIDIVTWRKLAEVCANNIGKGRLVAVDGQLQIRSYEDKQGVKRKAAEVVANTVKFLDWPKEGNNQAATNKPDFGEEVDFSEDDLPF